MKSLDSENNFQNSSLNCKNLIVGKTNHKLIAFRNDSDSSDSSHDTVSISAYYPLVHKRQCWSQKPQLYLSEWQKKTIKDYQRLFLLDNVNILAQLSTYCLNFYQIYELSDNFYLNYGKESEKTPGFVFSLDSWKYKNMSRNLAST